MGARVDIGADEWRTSAAVLFHLSLEQNREVVKATVDLNEDG